MKRNIVHSTWYSYDKNMFMLNEVNQDKQLCVQKYFIIKRNIFCLKTYSVTTDFEQIGW